MQDTRNRTAPPQEGAAANDGATSPAFTLTRSELEELVTRAVRAAQSSGSPEPALVDKQDLARQLGCSAAHIDHLRKKGLPCVPVGRSVRFEPAKVLAWLRGKEAQHG